MTRSNQIGVSLPDGRVYCMNCIPAGCDPSDEDYCIPLLESDDWVGDGHVCEGCCRRVKETETDD